MNRDEIIRMAREAYGDWYPNAVPNELVDLATIALERFAALVAASEREACAEICDRIASLWPGESLEGWHEGYVDGAGSCRNLIRERGEK